MSLVIKEEDHHSFTKDIIGGNGVLTLFLLRVRGVILVMYSEEVSTSPHLCSLHAELGTAV